MQSDRGIDVFELELQHMNFFIGLHGKLQRVIAAGRLCLCSLFESLCQVVVFHGEGNLIHLVFAVRMQPDTVQLVPVQIRKGQGAVAGNGDLALVVERSRFLIADFCGGKGQFLFGFLGGEAGDVEHQHFQQKDAAGNAGGGNRWEPVIWNPRIRACRSRSTRISPAVSIPILTAVFENSEPAGASFGSLHAARSRALHRIGSKK